MLVEQLRKKGVYDDGLAYEVTDKVMRGYYSKAGGVDEATMSALLDLGFDMDFVFFLSDIKYMFPKAHGTAYLHEAITMMFYKINFNTEYNEIMSEKMSDMM